MNTYDIAGIVMATNRRETNMSMLFSAIAGASIVLTVVHDGRWAILIVFSLACAAAAKLHEDKQTTHYAKEAMNMTDMMVRVDEEKQNE